MTADRLDDIERRLELLERRFELVEQGAVTDERTGRRVRTLNMWLRIALYASFLLLLVLFLVVFKLRF